MSDATPYVRPDVKMLLDMLAAMAGPKMNEIPLADARASYAQMAALVEADPVPLATIKDLSCPGPRGLPRPTSGREGGRRGGSVPIRPASRSLTGYQNPCSLFSL